MLTVFAIIQSQRDFKAFCSQVLYQGGLPPLIPLVFAILHRWLNNYDFLNFSLNYSIIFCILSIGRQADWHSSQSL
jgi:hypothetical protein